METKVRMMEDIWRMLQVQIHEEEPQGNDSTDSESDHEEELEGSDEDVLEEVRHDSSDVSNDDLMTREAKRVKRRRISQSVDGSTENKFLYGENGFVWSLDPPALGSRVASAQQKNKPRGIKAGASVKSEGAAWSLLLPDEILEKIVVYTNEAIASKQRRFTTPSTYTHNIDLLELKAFIGLLYFSGIQGSACDNMKSLYGKLSSPIFRATMPCARFAFLLSVLRFDDKTTRHERRAADKLAPIREVWDTFIGNSKSNFNPGQNVTIDEQLLSFRGRCAFRVCIKNKPDKHGLKIITMNDSETAYLIDAIPYVGQVVEQAESAPTYYVKKLSESIAGSNRNITCNRWFTSIPLVETLQKETSLTLVGTIRRDRPEIPEVMKTVYAAEGNKVAYANNMTLVSHCPEKNKVVLLISSLHEIEQKNSGCYKSEVMTYYNKTKSAIDKFEQMCHEHSVARSTRRWPLRFFYGILDQSSVNAFILFSLNEDNHLIARREFNEKLAYYLVTPFLLRRMQVSSLRRQVRALIEFVLDIDFATEPGPDVVDCILDKQTRCAFCPRNKDKKTKHLCSNCRQPCCGDHRSMQCNQCASH